MGCPLNGLNPLAPKTHGYKSTKNQLPHPDKLFSALNGSQKFTTLDLSEAYLQIELEEEAKICSTINTLKGLYAFNRLPYGMASSPAIFQCVMEQIISFLKCQV